MLNSLLDFIYINLFIRRNHTDKILDKNDYGMEKNIVRLESKGNRVSITEIIKFKSGKMPVKWEEGIALFTIPSNIMPSDTVVFATFGAYAVNDVNIQMRLALGDRKVVIYNAGNGKSEVNIYYLANWEANKLPIL